MRSYFYSRKDPNMENQSFNYVSYLESFGYKVEESRIIIEELSIDIPVSFRSKFISLIEYGLEKGDMLIVRSLDDLGSNFNEICKILDKIENKGLDFICLDFSKSIIKGELKEIFIDILKMCFNFELKYHDSMVLKKSSSKKVGRPEILNEKQKEEIMCKIKKGHTIYSIAKEYSVTRTVIQRIMNKNYKQIE